MKILPLIICVNAVLFQFSNISWSEEKHSLVSVIFDTDIGNDVDDVLALGMIHSLMSRGECKLLAVTVTKDHELAAPFVDLMNTFYGRPDIPIGVCQSQVTKEQGKFLGLASEEIEGKFRYPHKITCNKKCDDAVKVLRKTLAQAADQSVVIIQVGFSTNLANLLASQGDDVSPLSGVDLVSKKVKLLSIMAGAFTKIKDKSGKPADYKEYNIIMDLPAAQKLAKDWPTEVVWSGFEIGIALPYPHQSILKDYDYIKDHPTKAAYILYQPPPHDRPTWDLTSVLVAIRPDHQYFTLSERGQVVVDQAGYTVFTAQEKGKRQYLKIEESQKAKVLEALQLLSSEPPHQK